MGEVFEDGSFILDQPHEIAYARLCVHIARLKIEINTGMKSRLNTLRAAQINYGIKSKTRKGALKELETIRKEWLSQ